MIPDDRHPENPNSTPELARLLVMARTADLHLVTAEQLRQTQLVQATLKDKEANQ